MKSYNDLLREIEIYEARKEDLELEIRELENQMHNRDPKEISGQSYNDMPSGNRDDTTLDVIVSKLSLAKIRLNSCELILHYKYKSKEKIETILNNMEGLQYKVFFKHIIEGKTLDEISEELGYSYQYIKEINCKIKEVI